MASSSRKRYMIISSSESSDDCIQSDNESNYNSGSDEDSRSGDELIHDELSHDECMEEKSGTLSIESASIEESSTFYTDTPNDGNCKEFKSTSHPFSRDLFFELKKTFGLHKFRPNQLEAINAIMLGYDCFIIMPTGGGKSLCYQLPAVLSSGVTVVISPLLSLINDQTLKLKSLDIPVGALNSSTDTQTYFSIYERLQPENPSLKLLYITPEKLFAEGTSSERLRNTLQDLHHFKKLDRIAIDEVHCVSEWGHDFRPDYKELCVLRANFPGVPIIGLTATATPRVRSDILLTLNMTNPKWFLSSFNRPNLKYQVVPKLANALNEIVFLIKTQFLGKCGIVYCFSRKDTDDTAAALRSAGLKAVSYHAGHPDSKRSETQNKWSMNKVHIICATIAFGMGIDKPDVRYVIHYSMPKSIEGYYQETGRAGRDGKPSTCILFFKLSDSQKISGLISISSGSQEVKMMQKENLSKMVAFAENRTDCRREMQLNYFGEMFDSKLCSDNPSTACDNCEQKDFMVSQDVTDEARKILMLVQNISKQSEKNSSSPTKNYLKKQTSNHFTFNYIVDIFQGLKTERILNAGHDKFLLHGEGQHWNRMDIDRLMTKLLVEGYLREKLISAKDEVVRAYPELGPKADQLIKGNEKVELVMNTSTTSGLDKATAQNIAETISTNSKLLELQERCFNDLLDVCERIATSCKIPTSSVMSMQSLKMMSEVLPKSEEEMLDIVGITCANFLKYGKPFLIVTQNFASEKLILEQQQQAAREASSSLVFKSTTKKRYKRRKKYRKRKGTNKRRKTTVKRRKK